MRNQVIGNYKIVEAIGEGGMGKVFRGIDLMLEREVAIKLIRPEYARRPDFLERFRTEAKALARLNHPNIVTVHAFFQHQDHLFMIMEFIHGETLSARIAREPAMPWTRALPLFCQVLAGVEHAHSNGIIHRDIKPSNLIITNTGLVKVMDFGIARMVHTAPLTLQGDRIGTLTYMSPEQIQGKAVDARSDIYSLGLVLYKMLTGRAPFVHQNLYALLRAHIEETPAPLGPLFPAAPAELEAVILRALAKAPEQRVQTIGEFRTILEKMLRDLPTTVEERSLPGPRTDALSAVSTAAMGQPTLSDVSLADGEFLTLEDNNASWLAARTATDKSIAQGIFVEQDSWLPEPVSDQQAIGSAGPGDPPIDGTTAVATSVVPQQVGLTPRVSLVRQAEARSARPALWSHKSVWGMSAALGLGMAVALYAWQYQRAPENSASASPNSGSPSVLYAWQYRRAPENPISPQAAPAVQQPVTEETAQKALETAALQPAPAEAAAEPLAKPTQQPLAVQKLTPPRAEKTSHPAQASKRRMAERPAARTASWRLAKGDRKRLLSRPTAPVNTSRELILSIFPRED